MKSSTDNDRGLTLIELLIVLALLSVIIAGLFNLFSFAYRSFAWVDEETRRMQEARMALDLLGDDIRNAKPYEDKRVGVRIGGGGTQLYLGPNGKDQILYIVKDQGLWRQVHDGTGFKDQPGKLLEMVVEPGYEPFRLNEKTVFIELRVDCGEGNSNQAPTVVTADFTVRNGLLKRGE